jgi:carbon-monoxide dehydrogenase medium subunit
VGSGGSRVIAADKFFRGALTTALEPDEIIVAMRLPAWPKARRWGFEEFSPRRGDFALAAVAAFYDLSDGRAANAHVGVIGLGDRSHRLGGVEAILDGHTIDAATIEEAGRAAAAVVEAADDIHASGRYRRALVATLVERALGRAAGQDGD